jgi:S-formylglutathione hydrolase FrmB
MLRREAGDRDGSARWRVRRAAGPVAALIVALLAASPRPANAQVWSWKHLGLVNAHLNGQVVDYTHNHKGDHRIMSPILGQPRDLYVYLPPGYTPTRAYPLIIYLHMGFTDEHALIGLPFLRQLDRMIVRGEFPPVIVACPDATIDGRNSTRSQHSMFMNGVQGRYEDHLLQEVLPFLYQTYSIRPEAQAHALLGNSAGGFSALSIGIRNRHAFGVVATLAAPANGRYDNIYHDNRANFDPATYRWKTQYDPDEIVGRFYFGLRQVPANRYIAPVFGDDPSLVIPRVTAVNPADLILSTNLQPGEMALYLNYPARDNWNFDAHAESFAWLASQRGICVTLDRSPCRQHSLYYFSTENKHALEWMSDKLLPPG